MTEMMFITDLDIISQNSFDRQSTSSDSSIESSKMVKINSKDECPLSPNKPACKSLSSLKVDKIKASKQSSKSKQQIMLVKKDDYSKTSMSSKEIDIPVAAENISYLVNKNISMSPAWNTQEEEEENNKHSSMLEKHIHEQTQRSISDQDEGGEDEEVHQIGYHPGIDLLNPSQNQRHQQSLHLTNTSMKQISNPSLIDHNMDEKKSSQIKIKKINNSTNNNYNSNISNNNSNISLQLNYGNKKENSTDEMNTSNQHYEDKLKPKPRNSNLMVASNDREFIMPSQKSQQLNRSSYDVMLACPIVKSNLIGNVDKTAYQYDTNKIEKYLNRFEENLKSFGSIIKNVDSNVLQSSIKKSNIRSQLVSVYKRINEQMPDCPKHHSFQQTFTQLDSQPNHQISVTHNNINNRNSVFAYQTQQVQEPSVLNNQQMMEKISKFFGLPNLFAQQLGEGGEIEYSNQNNTLNIDNFDSIKNFKKFFPHNNFQQILLQHQLKKLAKQKGKYKSSQQIVKQRRQNIFQNNTPRKSEFHHALYLTKNLTYYDFNYISYRPTYLSYGVSQKGDTIFPKNLIKQEQSNTEEY